YRINLLRRRLTNRGGTRFCLHRPIDLSPATLMVWFECPIRKRTSNGQRPSDASLESETNSSKIPRSNRPEQAQNHDLTAHYFLRPNVPERFALEISFGTRIVPSNFKRFETKIPGTLPNRK